MTQDKKDSSLEVLSEDQNFLPLKKTELLSQVPLPFDLYVRLAKGKFIKIILQGDSLSEARLKRFLDNDDFDSFHFLKKDQELLNRYHHQSKTKTSSKNLSLLDQAYQDFLADFNLDGIDQAKLDQARRITESTFDLVMKNKDLKRLLHTLDKMGPQSFSHAFLTALIAGMMASDSPLSSPATIHSLILSCLFHDIGKIDLPEKVQTHQLEKLDEKELKQYQQHPLLSAKRLEKIPMVGETTLQAVSQHHERADGSGFPLGLKDNRIGLAAKYLGLADEFVKELQANQRPATETLRCLITRPEHNSRFSTSVTTQLVNQFSL